MTYVTVALCHSSADLTQTTPPAFDWFWCEVIHFAPHELHATRRAIAMMRDWCGFFLGTAVATRSVTCERTRCARATLGTFKRVCREPLMFAHNISMRPPHRRPASA